MSNLTITLIQTNLHWENKQANLDMFEEKIMSISAQSHLIILPEMFSTGFSMKPAELAEKMDGPTVEWMKRIAATKKMIEKKRASKCVFVPANMVMKFFICLTSRHKPSK